MQGLNLHEFARFPDHGVGRSQYGLVSIAESAWYWQNSCELARNDRERALRQIAEIIGKICIDAIDDRLMAVSAVLSERDFAQQKIPELVDPIGTGKHERVDHIADRFRHLLTAVEQEPV